MRRLSISTRHAWPTAYLSAQTRAPDKRTGLAWRHAGPIIWLARQGAHGRTSPRVSQARRQTAYRPQAHAARRPALPMADPSALAPRLRARSAYPARSGPVTTAVPRAARIVRGASRPAMHM